MKKLFVMVKRASLPSSSLNICTVCSPRIGEPKMEQYFKQGKRQEIELNYIITVRLSDFESQTS